MVSYEERIELFKEELDLIIDATIKEFTKLCLSEAPDYIFYDCPASSSGKYHPISELGANGVIIHTKKVVTVAYELCRGLDCENNRDEIISACLIHDLVKQGWTKTGYTQKSHPGMGAELVKSVQEATQMLSDKSYNIIRNAVGFHYGPWSQKEWLKSLKDYTPEELCVYMSDYVASKRCIEVNYKRAIG